MIMAESTESIKQLPQGWRWVKLEEVCKINPVRSSDLKRALNSLTTFIPMTAVDDREGKILHAELRPYSEVANGYTYFEEGDVLFAKITPCMQNGKHAIATGLADGIGFGSTEFHIIRPGGTITSEWVHRYIRQPVVIHEAEANFTGSVGQQRVPKSFLASLEIPLPPIQEQGRIIEIVNTQISSVEKARAAAEARLEATKALPAAYLREVFAGLKADGWLKTNLGKVCEIIAGQSPPSISYNKDAEGLPFFQGKADFGDNHPIPTVWCNSPIKIALPGDILISVRAPVGPTNVADVECCIGRGLAAIRCKNNISADYVLWFMKYYENQLCELGSGSTFSEINMSHLRDILIPLPSLSAQEHIASNLTERIRTASEMMSAIKAQLFTINALLGSLLQKAFSGGI